MQLPTRRWDRHGDGGLTFTELGLGTAPLGNLFRAIADAEATAILDAAWAGGVRHYDTAPLYGLGLAETRLNPFLRGKPRDAYVLATKVGRLLRATTQDRRDDPDKWVDVPARNEVYDFTHDGILRSVEFSLERLGVDRLDVLYAHDLDVRNQGSQAILDARLDELVGSGARALVRLRDEGTIRAFGAGVNEWQPAQTIAERVDVDLILLAGRYTLLEQEAARTFLPLCLARGIGVVVGGAYNSGILAGGEHYDYGAAPPAMVERVGRLRAACAAHGARLIDAAFRFPLRHPAVVSVALGCQTLGQMEDNLAVARANVPDDLWADLAAQGLIPAGPPSDRG